MGRNCLTQGLVAYRKECILPKFHAKPFRNPKHRSSFIELTFHDCSCFMEHGLGEDERESVEAREKVVPVQVRGDNGVD